MTDNETANGIDLLQDLVARARKAGADAADAVLFNGVSLSHARRLGKVEKLERSEGQDLGLRVLVGKRQAMVSSSDRSPAMLAEHGGRAVARRHHRLPLPDQHAQPEILALRALQLLDLAEAAGVRQRDAVEQHGVGGIRAGLPGAR